ncbi:SIR2 family protein [Bacillus pumilus]|uniref:SIR2 family protein n=1 Tax=Bacillus pumilus TaxID=1408 RepID=UPI00119FA67E|nr:SIR2 family protein [Bacillus pumilus]
MTITKQRLIEKYVKALESNTAAIFAGAGLSCAAGFVNWKDLLNEAADDLQLNIDKEEHDLVGLAQHYINKKRNRSTLNEVIMDQFSKRAALTDNHKFLAKLPISTYWTTNYDSMIEKALEDQGRIVDIKSNQTHLPVSVANKDATVYKMHGDLREIDKIILTRDDYERYNRTHPKFRDILEGDLLSKTFLFLGFSFTDPNISYILSRIRIVLEGNSRPHYCIFKEIDRNDYDNEDEFTYAKIKQQLHIEDLSRFSIETLLVQDYSEITEILEAIYNKYKRKTIFISGSAEEYTPFNRMTGQYFLHQLSKRLVEKDFKLVSGFGLGVGPLMINGVAEYINENKKSRLQNHLSILPFPQESSGNLKINDVWENNRLEMLSDCGIALFLFGNKVENKEGGDIVLGTGLKDEYDLAEQQGVLRIPIKATGYMAEKLSVNHNKDIQQQFNDQNRKLYDEIDTYDVNAMDLESIDEFVEKIVSLVVQVKKNN